LTNGEYEHIMQYIKQHSKPMSERSSLTELLAKRAVGGGITVRHSVVNGLTRARVKGVCAD